jgi:hypothetical protein
LGVAAALLIDVIQSHSGATSFGITRFLTGNRAYFRSVVFAVQVRLARTPLRFLADGDTVVLGEATIGGETSQDADVFTLRDGQTQVRAQAHIDTASMERVYGGKQVAAG